MNQENYNKLKFGKAQRKRKGAYLSCQTCKIEFYVPPCRLKLGQVKYCSMKCYPKKGDNNPFFGKKHSTETKKKFKENPNRHKFPTGKDNPNFIRCGDEYGFTGKSLFWWKRHLKKTIGKCEKCDYSDKRILQIHHKDKNNKNNLRKNLLLLCPNCHNLIHYKDKSGLYKNLSI